jgi:hypothetical protein
VKTRLEDVVGLYERCLSGVIEYLRKQMKVRRSIYTAQVVIWLMIVHRLQPRRTLAGGVEALMSGAADRPLNGCARARQKRISRRTGGYSHAGKRLPRLYAGKCWQNCSFGCAEFSTPKPAVVRIFWTILRWNRKPVRRCAKYLRRRKTSTDGRIGPCCGQ